MSDYNNRMKEWLRNIVREELSDDSDIENQSQLSEKAKRDYKAEYKKFQSSTKMKKYRAELNKYNRKKGTYGNGDGKDASHKGGKIVGFEAQSKNRGRAEKSRLKKESLQENLLSFYQYMGDFYGKKGLYPDKKGRDLKVGDINKALAVYLKKYAKDQFTGDSLDRERVRDILIKMKKIDPQYKKQEVKENKEKIKKYLMSKGDNEKDATDKLRFYDLVKKLYKGAKPAQQAQIMSSLWANESVNENVDAQIKNMMDRRERMKKSGASTSAINSVTQMIKKLRDRKRKSNESVNERDNVGMAYKRTLAKVELKKIKDAILMFQKRIKKQGRVTNARDEEHLKNLIKVYKQMGGKGVKESREASIIQHHQRQLDALIQQYPDSYSRPYAIQTKIETLRNIIAVNRKKMGESINEGVSKSQAQEIMRQLGGRKFEMLMGVKSKGVGKDGLIIHIGRNPKKISHIIIDIDRGKDLYNLTFGKIFKYQFKVVKKLKGIYVDQLHDMIEKYTGLLTTFRKR